MAALWRRESDHVVALGPRTLIGRGPECRLQLDSRSVSTSHALITFKDGAWWIRDLGSRNGTHLSGQRIEPGAPTRIPDDCRVRFGGEDVEYDWVAGPPGPVAVQPSGTELRASDEGLLALPDVDDPVVVVMDDGDGGWLLEGDDGATACVDGRVVDVAATAWRVHLPHTGPHAELASTWDLSAGADLTGVGLVLTVSQDEEHVDVQVSSPGGHIPLSPRVHHYLLLYLARARLADRGPDVPEAEQGWVYASDVCEALRLRPAALSLHMLRARQQLAEAGIHDPSALFERRRLSGQVRLGVADVTVSAG